MLWRLFLSVVVAGGLWQHVLAVVPSATAVWVFPLSGGFQTHVLDGTPEANGDSLRAILQGIRDGDTVYVDAPAPQVVRTQDIRVQADHFTIDSHPNLLIKANVPHHYVISCSGNSYKVSGLNVDGAGDEIGRNNMRGAGILCDGEGYTLEACQAANTPPGVSANGITVRGCLDQAALVKDCVATNPGYTCFRCSAVNATFDNITAIIDEHATPEQLSGSFDQNRLFNMDAPSGNQEYELVVIQNSRLEAHLSPNLPNNGPLSDPTRAYRQVGIVLDPGDLPHQWCRRLQIINTSVYFNDQVKNQLNDSVMKIANVDEVLLENLTIDTPVGYVGKALRLGQETEAVGISQDHKPRMRCTIRNCRWDQGIFCHGIPGADDYAVELLRIEGVNGQRTVLGRDLEGNIAQYSLELLTHFGLAKTVEIENADLYHAQGMVYYNDQQVPMTGETRISLRNVSFFAAGRAPQFVFRFSPPHASFLKQLNFTCTTVPGANLWLANGCQRRLAATSSRWYDNTMVFDPALASASCEDASHHHPLPPFDGITGVPGAAIYLASGWTPQHATELVPAWQTADRWEWIWTTKKTKSADGTRGGWTWQPVRVRAKSKVSSRL